MSRLSDTDKSTTNQGSKTVAVVVPLIPRPRLAPEEEVSLRHLLHFLGQYDKYLVVPKSLKVSYPGFGIIRFNDRFFGSARAHNKLLLSPQFYETFKEYKYILNYHLDCLVFSDELIEWCKRDLDYIGAPFIHCQDSPWVKMNRVGNGGFSLRKIESFLNVFYSRKYDVEPSRYWENFCARNPKYKQMLHFPKKYLKRLRIFNGARWEMSRWSEEDYFWSDQAVKYYSEFTIASLEAGLRFGFEVAPRLCFEMTNGGLPFGCHAWHRYDREFWEPYLLK